MHFVVVQFKLPFPGYNHGVVETGGKPFIDSPKPQRPPTISETTGLVSSTTNEQPEIPTWMYFFLAIPAIFDLGATALCMMGLRYIDVSIYQLLRGSGTYIFMFVFVFCPCRQEDTNI
jgi:hypothetical protein